MRCQWYQECPRCCSRRRCPSRAARTRLRRRPWRRCCGSRTTAPTPPRRSPPRCARRAARGSAAARAAPPRAAMPWRLLSYSLYSQPQAAPALALTQEPVNTLTAPAPRGPVRTAVTATVSLETVVTDCVFVSWTLRLGTWLAGAPGRRCWLAAAVTALLAAAARAALWRRW